MAVPLDFSWFLNVHTVIWHYLFGYYFHPLLTPFFDVLCTGEHIKDASVHADPASVLGRPVDGEDECLLPGTAFRSHSHHPSAHGHDWHTLHSQGDEMCKSPPQAYFIFNLSSFTYTIIWYSDFSVVIACISVAAWRRWRQSELRGGTWGGCVQWVPAAMSNTIAFVKVSFKNQQLSMTI